jgi:transcriptional regulator NrdR family protein
VFSTEESVQYRGSWAVRGKAGDLQPFWRDKLLLSLYRSCQHRPTALSDAGGLTDTIIKKAQGQIRNSVITSSELAQTVQVALNRFDRAASTHYQAFHRR